MNGTMVFDLDLRDNWSLSIDYEGKTELETKHRVAKILQDSIRVFLRGSLGAIRFPLPPIHIGEEDFTSDTTYLLRPKNIAFQIYSLPEGGGLDDSLACVSAYMKTEMTNFNAVLGDLKPEFCTTGQDKLYPIPRDHTASIIINRRMLFGEPCKKSIWQPIKDTKAFTSLGDDLMEDSIDSGFQLKMKWDGNYPVRDALSYAHYTGLYIGDGSVSTGDVVKAVNEAQPTLTVFDDGKMTWEPKIKVPFNIEVNFVPYRALIVKQGNWEYTAKASKDGKFEVDGLTLKGTLNLASSDWTIAYDKGDSGITEAFVGECLKHITWPTWDCNPTRNLKRLTNFAKPGAGDVITLKRDGLRVPHDFLLLGDVSK
ncbi:hypothetical protein F5Y14DRAFT_369567 [Nemania sp. NC0429]|nr:hypothetical protein F5Y14DRAFT_369567 [Nemania sp. NC0429]